MRGTELLLRYQERIAQVAATLVVDARNGRTFELVREMTAYAGVEQAVFAPFAQRHLDRPMPDLVDMHKALRSALHQILYADVKNENPRSKVRALRQLLRSHFARVAAELVAPLEAIAPEGALVALGARMDAHHAALLDPQADPLAARVVAAA